MSRFIANLGLTETETESNFKLPKYINVVDINAKQFGGADSESSPEFSLTSEAGGNAYSLTSEAGMVGGGKNYYTATSNSVTSVMAGGSGFSITSSMVGGGRGMSATSDFKPHPTSVNELVSMLTSESDNDLSQTNTEQLEEQLKGIVMEGGNNPGFKAFLDLKKHVATKLGISNGPKAAKVAGAVQKSTKAKNPTITDGVRIAELGKKAFDSNMDKYKKMLD